MKRLSHCAAFFFFLLAWLPAPGQAQPPAQAQTQTAPAGQPVTGQMLDGAGSGGLPGVLVLVPGTSLGTTTTVDGTFRLSGVPATATRLQFTFVGYRNVEQALPFRLLPGAGPRGGNPNKYD